ncbi:MAG TPA: divergent polysaccharide deacetylase family protein [Dongiaceae bacterium]|nr:divergent polysaccharide deacetylase family protein [Dongiaceae bacterium]
MARRTRTRSRRRPRRTTGRHVASSLLAARWLAGSGAGRFALGVLIGLGLGFGATLYLGGLDLSPRNTGGAKVTTVNATRIQNTEDSRAASVPKPAAPRVVEPAAPPPIEGEEATVDPAAASAASPGSPPSDTQPAAAAPAPPVAWSGDAAWVRNSVAFVAPHGRPMIAVVLDDVGVARGHADLAIDMPAAITLSFMTYADGVAEMAARARAKGHELMLHVPMEPLDKEVDPGPHALTVEASDGELLARLNWDLARFPGYIGINNHMGSRFTQDERGMRVVLQELKRRNLLFLDSRTIATTIGDNLAARMGVAHVMRDVFLDDEMDGAAVLKQLAQAEKIAAAKGQAIAIGHPHPATLAAIRAWMPEAEARGFVIVPLSAVAKQRLGASG